MNARANHSNGCDDGNHSTQGAKIFATGVTAGFLNATRHKDGVLLLSPDESMAGPALIRQ